jgi:hypothetical protein
MCWRALSSIERSESCRSFELNFLEFDHFRGNGLAHPWQTTYGRPGSTRRYFMFSPNRTLGSASQSSSTQLGVLLSLALIVASPLSASKQSLTLPDDLALRIRLDDTLTSTDSQVGDPFSATVVDKGAYQGARVYGRIRQIEMSGKIKGRTTMMLEFNRLVMPDGRRAPIRAEIIELYHAPTGEKVDVEGAIESGGRGRKTIEHTAIGVGAGALLGGIFSGGKGAGIGSVVGGAAGLGTTAFKGHQKITLNSGWRC